MLRDRGVLPRQPAELFHYLRRVGNAAVHDNLGTPAEALSALKQARQLGIWFIRGYGRDSRFNPAPSAAGAAGRRQRGAQSRDRQAAQRAGGAAKRERDQRAAP